MIQYQPSPPPIEPSSSCRTSLIGRMADDMREMAFSGQNVSAETLVQRGWTASTIRRLSSEAVIRARRASVRRLS